VRLRRTLPFEGIGCAPGLPLAARGAACGVAVLALQPRRAKSTVANWQLRAEASRHQLVSRPGKHGWLPAHEAKSGG
jgi:hypothetical protein